MGRETLHVLSAVTLSIVAASTVATAGPATGTSRSAIVLPPARPIATEPPRQSASIVEVPQPDLPAPVTGLEAPPGSMATGFAAVPARSIGPELWSVPDSTLRAIFAEPVALRVGLPPSSPPDTRSGAVAERLGGELASRDASLSRLTVPPPPRPAFLAARPPAGGRGLVEVSVRDGGGATWTALAPAAGTSAVMVGLSGQPERTIGAGIASWYGPGFHGRKTASGERFDQNALTAAHRSLPFGSRVRVVDEKTGRSIVVRINDRGPFAHGRVIDLSKASAEALGLSGLGRVRIVSGE